MSEENNPTVIDENGVAVDEREVLMARAKELKMRVSPKISLEKLRAKVNAAIQGEPDPDEGNDDETGEESSGTTATQKPVEKADDEWTVEELRAMPKIKREQIIRRLQLKEEMRLVRCQIYNLDQSKADLNGEIFTVQTKYLGSYTKMVPYGERTEGGYHIPNILYKMLKKRKFLQKRSVWNEKKKINELKTQWVPEFNIVVLDPLTDEELEELRLNQEAAKRVGA